MSCPCPPPGPPTLAGFTAFVQNVMGISTTILPADSAVINMAFCVALQIVNRAICSASPLIYELCVYNLAGSNVLNFAQDLPDAAVYKNKLPFFAYTRKFYNMLGFTSGIIQAAADESTSESLVVQDAAKDFTLANLQQLKDPYGRQYLAFAQSYGPSVWGLT